MQTIYTWTKKKRRVPHKDGFKGYKAIEHYTINTICIHVGYPAYIIPVDQMLEFVIKGK